MSEIKRLLDDLKTQYKLLKEQRESLRPVWKELADNFIPLKRQILEESATVDQIYQSFGLANDHIYDSTPIIAVEVAAAGMQGGITSPAQRWFQLGHPDPETEKNPDVKSWLEDAQNIMFDVMSRSNFYNTTHETYLEIPVFGTAVFLVEEDLKEVIRCSVITIGEYVLGEDSNRRRTALFREIAMTAEQIVERFGESNASIAVQSAARHAESKQKVFTVIHAVFPNKKRVPGKIDRFNKPFLSVYFEDNEDNNVLSIGGFNTKPFMAPRWGVVGRSVYGVSPAMNLLPFAKQLQEMSLGMIEASQLELQPPLNVPPGMKRVDLTPGALNPQKGAATVSPTINVKSNPQMTLIVIQAVQAQIREGLFNDLFKALALSPDIQMTATEVRERVVEGLRLLGPVLERLQHEFLSPLIDRVFDICFRRGLFPEPPEQLEGASLDIEYISPLAQAQKSQGMAAINQFMAFLGLTAEFEPTVVDTVDFDNLLTEYADLSGVSPKILNSSEEVEQKRQLRAQAQEIQAREQIEKSTVDNMKTMSETDIGGGNNALQAAAQGAAT